MAATDPSDGAEHSASELREFFELVRRHLVLIAASAAAALVLGVGWLATRTPVYRATATILLEQSQPTGGVLGELAALRSAPAAASEIALLRSRSLASKAILPPPDGSVPTPENPHSSRHLGLTTLVESPDQQPILRLVHQVAGDARGGGNLYAQARFISEDAAEALRVNFDREGNVTLTGLRPGSLGRYAAGESTTQPVNAKGRYACDGIALQMDTRGDVRGREFLVRPVSELSALKRLLGATRVVEAQRNSGVISLTVDDSDPDRAAAIANALCNNYFDLNVERGRKRASQTVEFIQGQLDEQLTALETAEREVVALQSENTDAIDPSATAEALIEDLSTLEVQRMRLDLLRAAVAEALSLLEEGDFDALARIGEELDDPLSRSLLEQLSEVHMRVLLHGRTDRDGYAMLLETRAGELRQRTDELANQIASVRDTLHAIEDGLPGAYGFLSDSPAADGIQVDPLTIGYLAEIARLESETAALRREFLPNYPPLAQAEAALANLREKVHESLHGRLLGLQQLFEDRVALTVAAERNAAELPAVNERVDREALASLRGQLERQLRGRSAGIDRESGELQQFIDGLEARLSEMPEHQRLLASPLRRLETHKEIAGFLLKSLQEAEITRASTVAAADYIDSALAPDLRYSPRIGFTLVLSLIAGLGAGIGLAWMRESLRRSLDGPSELEAVTGLPVLATVPDFRSGKHRVPGAGSEFIALRDDPHGVVAEAYRSLRANLRFAIGDVSQLRTMAATSCAPGEGKSTTNIDIAWAFASGGRRVCLVDADMRRPSVHRYLELERGPGLAEVLAGEISWRDAVRPTENPQLQVIPAGVLRSSAGDALGTAEAQDLIDQLTASFDLVIFDLPPALAVADVETFAHRLDAVLLLYRSGGLPRDAVSLAATKLRQAGAKLVGCVMNAHRADRATGGDSFQGNYGYGYIDEGGDAEGPSVDGVEAPLPQSTDEEYARDSAHTERR